MSTPVARKCESVVSPIVPQGRVIEEARIAITELKARYRNQLNLDIDRLCPIGTEYLTRYRCEVSGYRFYDPVILGDSAFYRNLQCHPWYYMPSKWEFAESLSYVPVDREVSLLEVGCGRGDFLRHVRQHNASAISVGLELNGDAVRDARAQGLDVRLADVEQHATDCLDRYDIVASFQVLEHVADPMSFLRSAVRTLRVGGVLIIAVPDNSDRSTPSMFVGKEMILNMPPHHQGLWDTGSLSFLGRVLPLRLDRLIVEPATAVHHSNSYRGLMKRDLLNRFGRVCGLVLYACARPFYDHALSHLGRYLPAHTVLAVYRKV